MRTREKMTDNSIATPQARRWPLFLTVLVVADVAATFESQMILAALKVLHSEFGNPVGVAWLVSAYLVVAAVAAAICGRLGDLVGRKRMIAVALSIAAAGSALSASARELEWIIVGRAMQGVSGAVLPLCFGLVRQHLPEGRTGFGGGILISASSFGAVAGLIVGGLVVDHMHWRDLFWLSAALAAGAVTLVLLVLPREVPQPQSSGLDLLGGLLFAPAIAGILLAISNAGEWGIGDPKLVLLAAGSIVFLAWWIVHELNHKRPLFDVRMLARKEMALSNIALAILGFGPFQLTLVMMLFLQQSPATGIGFGLAAAAAGTLKLPGHIVSITAAPLAGHLCRIVGERWIVGLGFLLNAVAWILMFIVHQNLWLVLAVTIVSTIAGSICFVGLSNNVMRIAPQHAVSEAIGLATLMRTIAQACGSQIVTITLAGVLAAQATESVAPAYLSTFAFMLATAFVGLLIATALPPRSSAHPAK